MSWDAVLIAGPTASGKSTLAIEIAEKIGGTVINADSMQVYSELRILSARPDVQVEARTPHLLYGHVPVVQRYSVGRYLEEAIDAFSSQKSRGRIPIFVGGSGLYFNALTEGLSPIPEISPQVRKALEKRMAEIGLPAFYDEFSKKDPETMDGLRPSDKQRVLRAACVFVTSGRGLKKWQEIKGTSPLEGLDTLRIVLAPPRDLLQARIAKRFESMIKGGAIEEARTLASLDLSLPAAGAIGLPQLRAYLRQEINLTEAVNQSVTETQRYAKRQMTWFRRFMVEWKWLENGNLRNIIS
jgi:tRNA dimethylallyltransferase